MVYFTRALCCGMMALLLSACASAPKAKPYTLKFELAPSLTGSSVRVDLIGANAVSDLPKWQSYSVSEYWNPDNAQRRDADKAVLEFGPGKGNVQTFTSSDPIWSRWLSTGAMHLVVLAHLPGVAADREGNADSRRLILPLDAKKWPADAATIEVRIQESGLRLMTPVKAL